MSTKAKIFADNVRRLREQLGWNQQDLAQRIGVSAATIHRYEGGKTVPELPNIEALARVFRCSADDLRREGAKSGTPVEVRRGYKIVPPKGRELSDAERDKIERIEELLDRGLLDEVLAEKGKRVR